MHCTQPRLRHVQGPWPPQPQHFAVAAERRAAAGEPGAEGQGLFWGGQGWANASGPPAVTARHFTRSICILHFMQMEQLEQKVKEYEAFLRVRLGSGASGGHGRLNPCWCLPRHTPVWADLALLPVLSAPDSHRAASAGRGRPGRRGELAAAVGEGHGGADPADTAF